MQFCGDERTQRMLERATEPGTPEAESLEETHGMISKDRAPHQELRRKLGF
jgi:hypothetical protein